MSKQEDIGLGLFHKYHIDTLVQGNASRDLPVVLYQ